MKNFMLKTWWGINSFATICLIITTICGRLYFTWNQEPPTYLMLLWLFGVVGFFVGQISIIHLHGIATSEDQIDEKWRIVHNKEKELDKLVDFMKSKAFQSTVTTKEEIRKHMGWEDKEK